MSSASLPDGFFDNLLASKNVSSSSLIGERVVDFGVEVAIDECLEGVRELFSISRLNLRSR